MAIILPVRLWRSIFLTNLRSGQHSLYHLQQAVEKVLKAIIILNSEYPAFTHDIDKLAEHCKKLGEKFSDNPDDISDSLTLWESKSRYDPYITFSQAKYDKAKKAYEEISDSIKGKIENL